MQGARTAPTEARPSFLVRRIAAGILPLLLCSAFAQGPVALAAQHEPITIDFTQHGQGPFDPRYFAGVDFTEGSFVGYVQGDQALVGPVAADVDGKFTAASASFAPATQGTAIYTLTALKGNGRPLASSSVTVTQDEGDPASGPWGYATITLDGLSKKARSFRLANEFVRSSHSHIRMIEFGVASISISP